MILLGFRKILADSCDVSNISATLDSSKILVVDLDGTLLKSDLLYETFWSAFSDEARVPFKSLLHLASGKAALKNYLANTSDIDFTTLPYNERVIDFIKSFRETGGRTALVTSSNNTLALRVSGHLGIFDEVYGSTINSNLKGNAKAKFLNKTYGIDMYHYMGNSRSDLAVWKNAHTAILVDTGNSLQEKCSKYDVEMIDFQSSTRTSSHLETIKAIRPHQWMKNFLVFLPVLAAHKLSIEILVYVFAAFISFSLMASAIYVVNDLLDLKSDRLHPRKKKRPFASGDLPISLAAPLVATLFSLSIAIGAFVNGLFLFVIFIYFIFTLAYSLSLKRKPIYDIFTLAGLYTLRVIGGGFAAGIDISFWLIAFSLFIFLALASIKRQAEMVDLKKRSGEKVPGRGYHVDDLAFLTVISLTSGFMSVLVVALYINSSEVLALYSSPAALWGVCLALLLWVVRASFLAHQGLMHDDPIIFAFTDKVSWILLTFVSALFFIGLVK